MDSEALADIDAFLRLDIGDAGRLKHIKSMLQEDLELYNSDKKYLESLKEKYIGNVSKPDIQNHDNDDIVENEDLIKEEAIPQDKRSYDVAQDKNIVIINQPRQSSAAWYLLPIFFSIIGGLISFFCLRRQDPSRARKTLVLGIVLSIFPILLLAAVFGFVNQEFEDTKITVTDLTVEQIKQSALAVPYTSLMEESEQYTGEIIQYEGQVVQVQKNSFGNTYVMRIATATGGLAGSDVIWSNFKSNTDEESEWLAQVNKENNPFAPATQDNSVRVFGIVKGLKDYSNIFGGTVTIPEVDVLILERNIKLGK